MNHLARVLSHCTICHEYLTPEQSCPHMPPIRPGCGCPLSRYLEDEAEEPVPRQLAFTILFFGGAVFGAAIGAVLL